MPDLAGFELRDPVFLLLAALALPVYYLASRLPSVVTYSSLAIVDDEETLMDLRLVEVAADHPDIARAAAPYPRQEARGGFIECRLPCKRGVATAAGAVHTGQGDCTNR